jgi:hypothetical protein
MSRKIYMILSLLLVVCVCAFCLWRPRPRRLINRLEEPAATCRTG